MTVEFVAASLLPTEHGLFTIHAFIDSHTKKEHIALVMGSIADGHEVLARVHSECLTGDAFSSLRCDCGPQLNAAMQLIAEQGHGVILYLRQEGRDIGLLNKIRAYHLQDQGLDTVEANLQLGFEADQREYSMCAPMLAHLGVKHIRLLTNNPRKIAALKKFGVEVVDRVPLQVGKNTHNEKYLETKTEKLGHLFQGDVS